jgi:MerR family transcriptional regulator, thiopeptide resistance regulator
LYRDRDLVRLEQIVVLKFLGLPLKQIGRLLTRESSLADALRRQQVVLAATRRQLDLAIHAIGRAERSVQAGGDPDWELFRTIVREIEMQNSTDWSKKYYSEGAKAKIEERKALWNPELQAQVTEQWTALIADVTAALAEDPAGPKAQSLAARWRTLVAGFTGGDPEVQKGLNKMWADKDNWPAENRERFQIDPRVQEFIVKAMNVAG